MPAPITEANLLTIIGLHLQDAQGYGMTGRDAIQANRENALAYYLGNKNGREAPGKSSVVSTDVADAIEWMMPAIMKELTSNNDVVRFDPTGADDEAQAELESDFVYEILMKDNEGFVAIHEFVKDALMQKNGIIKAYYAKKKKIVKEDYTGIVDEQLQVLLSDPAVELVSHTPYVVEGITFHDVRVNRTEMTGKINVSSVAPEKFCISANHNSIFIDEAPFYAHIEPRTLSSLVEEGYDKDMVYAIGAECSASDDDDQVSAYRFIMQGEEYMPDQNDFDYGASQKEITVAECYLWLDIDGDGISERVKVTVAGSSNPTAVLGIEEIDGCPFVSTTAILMSHKFFGLSIFDRLWQIQDHKTALWRNTMDNIYLQNNQRMKVLEGQVNLDDLLVSRPGGIVRVKSQAALEPIVTPPIGDAAYRMLDYLDMTRAGRVGVDANGDVKLDNIGDRVGSEGIRDVMDAKQELVNLIIRVVAETGMKPLCYLIRDLAVKHMDAVYDFRFKENWVKVDPKSWNRRLRSTVRVGLGSGDKTTLMAAAQQILTLQEKALANPQQAMVAPKQIYNALEFAAKQMGVPGISRFFMSPDSEEGKAKQKEVSENSSKQEEQQRLLAMANFKVQQALADAEQSKANAMMQKNQLQAEIDDQKLRFAALKEQSINQIKELQQALDSKNKSDELEFKYHQNDTSVALKLTEIEAKTSTDQDANFDANEELVEDSSESSTEELPNE